MANKFNNKETHMTAEQMKQIKVDDVLLDSKISNKLRKVISCLVIKVKKEGLLVVGADKESSIFYYNDITNKKEEMIPWSKAYSLEMINQDRINEPGYLLY